MPHRRCTLRAAGGRDRVPSVQAARKRGPTISRVRPGGVDTGEYSRTAPHQGSFGRRIEAHSLHAHSTSRSTNALGILFARQLTAQK